MLSFRATKTALLGDIKRLNAMSPQPRQLKLFRKIALMLRPELMALLLYRLAHYYYMNKKFSRAQFFYRLNLLITGADINPRSEIGTGCLLVHTIGLLFDGKIGNNATIYGHCIVQPIFTQGTWSALPKIGDDCTLCLQSSILGAVNIADNITIAPFTLLRDSINDVGVTVAHDNLPSIKIYSRRI